MRLSMHVVKTELTRVHFEIYLFIHSLGSIILIEHRPGEGDAPEPCEPRGAGLRYTW